MPLPAMSGAEPWTASKTAASSPMLAPGHDAQAADQAGAEVADQVAVEVLHQQHVEAGRVLHQLHAAGVDDQLLVLDVRVLVLVDAAGAAEEQAVGHLHDVGLVEDGDLLPVAARGVAEGEAGDARAGRLGGDLEAA